MQLTKKQLLTLQQAQQKIKQWRKLVKDNPSLQNKQTAQQFKEYGNTLKDLNLILQKSTTPKETSQRQAKEEKYYEQATTQIGAFFKKIESGAILDPQKIETTIAKLEKHLHNWQAFAKGQSTIPNDLMALEIQIKQLQEDWATEKAATTAFHEAERKLMAAIEAKEPEAEVIKLYKELKVLAN